MDSAASSAKDNPFASSKQQLVGKISVALSTVDWLCHEMNNLNLTLVQGYPSRSITTLYKRTGHSDRRAIILYEL